MTQHRLVVDEEVARGGEGWKSLALEMNFIHQLTHITRERNCLRHDDRVDCVAGAVGHLVRVLAQDPEHARKTLLEDEKDRWIAQWFNEAAESGPRFGRRGVMRNGEFTEVWQVSF
ncbi:hypothetical protein [Oceanibacterium hippocampi]|uniref:Uncharacterized protein n=1 Tax=Oceanibacterium hippocampi TaxID=745714 RepID=A0A1Y5U446_9PROT|nr:hypothetical protein [Oceanibacterium hippocampi]SLN76398.1 hypothetical protein OCH7691_04119 [Oceanibacterium hippocampi]